MAGGDVNGMEAWIGVKPVGLARHRVMYVHFVAAAEEKRFWDINQCVIHRTVVAHESTVAGGEWTWQ